MDLKKGKVVSGYEIVGPLGHGGQSRVYRAVDTALRREVALKFLSESFLGDDVARQRFLLEARALSTLNHPGIATVYQIGEWEGVPFIAMEYIEGSTLFARLQAGPLPHQETMHVMRQVAEAVGYAHGRGILHRDLKPGNVVVTPEGKAKLLDFGLAKLTSDALRERMSVAGDLTSTGSVVGTVSYLSPEQARGEEIDHRSDLFSLGVILYEMLAGGCPFTASTPVATVLAILKDPLPPFPSKAGVPQVLQDVVATLLEKDPPRRFSSAAELVSALDDAADHMGLSSSLETTRHLRSAPRTLSPRQRRRRTAVVAALVTLTLAGVTLGIFKSCRSPGQQTDNTVLVVPLRPSGAPDSTNLAGLVSGQIVDTLSRARGIRVLAAPEAESGGSGQAGFPSRARYVVDGSLFSSDGQLALTTKLTEQPGRRVLWSETIRGRLDEVFTMAARQAAGVAGAIGVYLAANQIDFPGEGAFEDFALGSLALASYNPGQLATAVSLLERCVAAAPGFAPAYSKLARALLQYRNLGVDYSPSYLDRAGAVLAKGIEVDPGDPELYANLGWLKLYTYDFEGTRDAALEVGRRGLVTESGCKLVVWDRFVRGDTEGALAMLGQCRTDFPLDPSIPLNLVVLNAMVGNSEAALAHMRDLEESHSSELVLTLGRSWRRLTSGEAATAATELREAFRRDGALMLGLQWAQASLLAGDYRSADEGLGPWLAKNPYSLEGHWMRCLARDAGGDDSGAREAARKAVAPAAEFTQRYGSVTAKMYATYFRARSAIGDVEVDEVRAIPVGGEAAVASYLQQVTLSRLGVAGALDHPATPFSPTFWLNRLAVLEVESIRTSR